MSIVGQKEIRGDIWLVLSCGHMVRREAYDDKCNQCAIRPTPPPRDPRPSAKPKTSRRKPKAPEYTPYDADTPIRRRVPSPPEKKDKYPREPFYWRGKMRR